MSYGLSGHRKRSSSCSETHVERILNDHAGPFLENMGLRFHPYARYLLATYCLFGHRVYIIFKMWVFIIWMTGIPLSWTSIYLSLTDLLITDYAYCRDLSLQFWEISRFFYVARNFCIKMYLLFKVGIIMAQ